MNKKEYKNFLLCQGLVVAVVLLFSLLHSSLGMGQDNLAQLRVPTHIIVNLTQHWGVAVWEITNIRQSQPDNANLLFGPRYRWSEGWMEALAHRQWSSTGNQWQLDLRFNQQLTKRLGFYGELYPLSTKHTFAETAVVDYRVWQKLKVGGEMENTHKKGPDSYGGGPRVGYQIFERGRLNTTVVGTYHFRGPGEPNFFRVYVLTNLRF